jgi:hypothetical protein
VEADYLSLCDSATHIESDEPCNYASTINYSNIRANIRYETSVKVEIQPLRKLIYLSVEVNMGWMSRLERGSWKHEARRCPAVEVTSFPLKAMLH